MKQRKVMMLVLAAALGASVLGGCGTKSAAESGNQTSVESEQKTSADAEKTGSSTAENKEQTEKTESSIFREIAGEEFYFSSGAGAWHTALTIDADGSFSGTYQDVDAGDSGSGYPNGTMYLCEFKGSFTAPKKIDENTYYMQVKELKASQPDGKEEIKDGQKIIYTAEPNGLAGAKDMYIYLPGTPVSVLPEGFLSWVNITLKDEETLPFYGLYNLKGEEGFVGPEKKGVTGNTSQNSTKDSNSNVTKSSSSTGGISSELKTIESQAAAIENRLQNEALDQSTMNKLTAQLYKLWDDELNSIWSRLKTSLDSATMKNLTDEEKKWISNKEAAIKEAGKECEGGSMQPMLENQTGADLTKQRVYELSQYLK